MVNLKFNPKNPKKVDEQLAVVRGKLSKSNNENNEFRLNPFGNTWNTGTTWNTGNTSTQEYSVVQGVQGVQGVPNEQVINLIGLENYYYIIKKWYSESLEDKNTKFLLLIGPTGCGKTTLVNNFCIENNILPFRTNDNIKNKKDLLKDIVNFTQFNNINSYSDKINNSNKLIFIDEYSNSVSDLLNISDLNYLHEFRKGGSSTTSKILIRDLISLFGLDWNILKDVVLPPIIIISADCKGSRLSELKKITDVYYINEINKNVIKNWLMNKNEVLKKNEDFLINLINKCNSDIRILLNTIEFIGDDAINDTKKNKRILDNFYKNVDVNLFDFINRIFDNIDLIDIQDIFNIYDTDGYLISNLVQENYIDYSSDIENIAKSADSISYGDVVFNDLYDSNKVFVEEVHCIYSIYIPSFYSRSDVKNNKCQVRTSVLNNRYNIFLNNKKILDKLNVDQYNLIDIFTVFFIKKFMNYELIKNKTINKNQLEYLRNILNTFNDNKIEKLELIYKSFCEFKDIPINKTKSFTIKFKDKLLLLNGS